MNLQGHETSIKNRKHLHNGSASLADDVKELLKTELELAKIKGSNMLMEAGDDVKKRAIEARNVVGTYTKRQPFKALGIAAVVGIIAALWVRK